MLYSTVTPAEKRRLFRERLNSGELLRFPGAFNPLSARLIEQKGFDGVYISGAVLSADLGLPDIGLTTLTEVAAALRVDLVLDVRAGQARVFELLDRAGDVHRLAEAGVGVDDRGEVGHAGDLLRTAGDLGQRGESDVGQPEVGGEHGAGDVHAVEALLLYQACAQRVERPGEAQQLAARQPLTKQSTLLGRRDRGVQHQNSPAGAGAASSRPGFATIESSPTSAAVSSGRRCTRARNRSISAGSSTGSANRRNFAM